MSANSLDQQSSGRPVPVTHPPATAIIIAAGLAATAAFMATVTLPLGSPPRAQERSACVRETLGAAACFGGKLCECVYDRGGRMTGMPAGYRWDCGILRPQCGGGAGVPATLNPYTGPYPLSVGIDRSDRSVNVDQNSTNTNANVNANTNLNANVEGDVTVPPPPAGRHDGGNGGRPGHGGRHRYGGYGAPVTPDVGEPVPLLPPD